MLLLINVTDCPGFWVSDLLFKDFMFEDLKSTDSASSQGLFSRLRECEYSRVPSFSENKTLYQLLGAN